MNINVLEDIKKLKPPLFIVESNATGPSVFYTNKELGWDEKGNVYVNPELELSPVLMSGTPSGDNTFRYYDNIPRKPHVFDKDNWKQIARPNTIAHLKVYNDQVHFRDFIKHIFS